MITKTYHIKYSALIDLTIRRILLFVCPCFISKRTVYGVIYLSITTFPSYFQKVEEILKEGHFYE